jgi:hypothetical protein
MIAELFEGRERLLGISVQLKLGFVDYVRDRGVARSRAGDDFSRKVATELDRALLRAILRIKRQSSELRWIDRSARACAARTDVTLGAAGALFSTIAPGGRDPPTVMQAHTARWIELSELDAICGGKAALTFAIALGGRGPPPVRRSDEPVVGRIFGGSMLRTKNMPRVWRGMVRSPITLVERVLLYCNLLDVRVVGFVAFRDLVCVVGLDDDVVGAFGHTSCVPIKGGGDGEAIADWRSVNISEPGGRTDSVEVEPSLRRSGVGLALVLNRCN